MYLPCSFWPLYPWQWPLSHYKGRLTELYRTHAWPVWRINILTTGIYIQHLPLLCRGSGSASVYGRKDTFLLSFSNVCKTSIYWRKMSFCLGTYWGKLPSIIITDDSIGDPHPVYIPNYGLCPVLIGIIGKNNSCVFHQWSWNVLHTWTTSNFFHSNLLLWDLFIICSKLYGEKTVH